MLLAKSVEIKLLMLIYAFIASLYIFAQSNLVCHYTFSVKLVQYNSVQCFMVY